MSGNAISSGYGAMSPEDAASKISKISKRMAFMIAAGSAFTFTIITATMANSAVDSIKEFRAKKENPRQSSLPPHILQAQMIPGSFQPAILNGPAEPAHAWFPENNRVDWKVSMRPGDVPSAFSMHNSLTTHNRMVLFYIATGNPAYPWQPAATLYLQAGKEAQMRLPRGRYLIQSINAPVEMPYEQAIRKKPITIAQMDFTHADTGRLPDLQIELLPTEMTTFWLSNAKNGGQMPAYRTAAAAYPSLQAHYAQAQAQSTPSRSNDVITVSSDNVGRKGDDYSGLVAAAIANN